MDRKGNLLCIDKDSMQLEQRKLFLESNGYRVSTASTDLDSLAFAGSSRIDAIVLGCTDDLTIAKRIRQISDRVAIVVVVTTLDLPNIVLDSIDALVGDFDGDQFLLDTLHFLLKVKPGQGDQSARRQNFGNDFAKGTAATWRSRVAPE
jgi:DNA-binding response OmpR family regulator